MRRLLVAGLLVLAVPVLAVAGPTVTQGNNTLQIKAKLDPNRASPSKQRLRPVELRYDYVAGTTNDKRLPDLRSVQVFLGGARFAFGAFPTCNETQAAEDGDGVCPKGSRVGSGTAVAEIHPPDSQTTKTDLEVDVTVYNGELDTDVDGSPMEPRSGLLIYTEVAGSNVALPFWGERRNRQVGYHNPESDPDPQADSLYAIKEIHLTLPRRTKKRGGRKIPFLAAPTRCKRRWTVTTTNEPYSGQALTAKHAVRCKKA